MRRLAVDHRTSRIDTRALKQAVRLEEVAIDYGIELKRQGRALVGRCPLHADAGRPNFYVYAQQEPQSWRCYRCGVGGDVVALVMRVEGVGFREAVERLGTGRLHATPHVSPSTCSRSPSSLHRGDRAPDEADVLQAATSLYHQQLLAEPRALEYLSRRGIGQETIRNYRLGYATGDALLAYLRWRQLPLGAALHVGLLTHAGQDFLNDRLVVPHLTQNGRATWLIGRALHEDLPEDTPRYLGLPGPKPLLGY
jgi:DNA primase